MLLVIEKKRKETSSPRFACFSPKNRRKKDAKVLWLCSIPQGWGNIAISSKFHSQRL